MLTILSINELNDECFHVRVLEDAQSDACSFIMKLFFSVVIFQEINVEIYR